jgi:nucleoside-diphosphate-sugar epimerase
MIDVGQCYRNKSVAITGGTGFLASAMSEALGRAGARIVLVSRRAVPHASGIEPLQADVRTPGCWDGIVARAEIIFHLAGNTSVYAARNDPAESLVSTVLPLTHLAAAARRANRHPRVLYASTATVYGLTDNLPVAETTPLRPITTYDQHKVFAEKELALASSHGILDGVSLRLSNVYGPSQSASSSEDRGILNKITRLALEGADVRLYGDGSYVRDYVFVDDVVRAFLAAGVHDGLAGRSFNVASGKGVTVRDAFQLVLERVAQKSAKRSRLQPAPWPADADPIEFRHYVADTSSLHSVCGWTADVPLQEGVDRLIAHLTANRGLDG